MLRWLLENRAAHEDIEVPPRQIAASIWVGCSERTVQRAIAFFRDAGILATWERYDDLGAPLPPGGRLLWDSVLQSLGREPEGTEPPAVSLDGRRHEQRILGPAAVFVSPAEGSRSGEGVVTRAQKRGRGW